MKADTCTETKQTVNANAQPTSRGGYADNPLQLLEQSYKAPRTVQPAVCATTAANPLQLMMRSSRKRNADDGRKQQPRKDKGKDEGEDEEEKERENKRSRKSSEPITDIVVLKAALSYRNVPAGTLLYHSSDAAKFKAAPGRFLFCALGPHQKNKYQHVAFSVENIVAVNMNNSDNIDLLTGFFRATGQDNLADILAAKTPAPGKFTTPRGSTDDTLARWFHDNQLSWFGALTGYEELMVAGAHSAAMGQFSRSKI